MTPDIRVLFEDNHLLAIEKPPGLLSQGDHTGDVTAVDLVKHYLKEKYRKPGEVYLGLLHRLDRPTGGVLLMARTSKAAQRMSRLFHDRQVDKRYLAMTDLRLPCGQGELEHYLRYDENKKQSAALPGPAEGAKKARLRYRTLARRGELSLLEIELLSGRKHQIRAQLAAVGCPILGDLKYRQSGRGMVKEFALWAYSLRFEHPVRKEPIEVISFPSERLLWAPFSDDLSDLKKKFQ